MNLQMGFDSYWKCLISCYIPLFVMISWTSFSKTYIFLFQYTHSSAINETCEIYRTYAPLARHYHPHSLALRCLPNLFLFPTKRTVWHAQPQSNFFFFFMRYINLNLISWRKSNVINNKQYLWIRAMALICVLITSLFYINFV